MSESAKDLAVLQREYTAQFSPQTPEERFLVEELARNDFSLRLLFQAERTLLSKPPEEIFADGGKLLGALQRRIAQARKAYFEALHELQAIAEERRLQQPARPAPAPEPRKAAPVQPAAQPQAVQTTAVQPPPPAQQARNTLQFRI